MLAAIKTYVSEQTWTKEVLADLKPGLKAFGEIKPREFWRANPLPYRGLGVQSDGAVTLAIYLRAAMKGVPLREQPNATIDSLRLTATELSALLPSRSNVGVEWAIPESLARKFSRVLGPSNETSMPRADEVESVRFTGKLRAVQGGIGYVVYQGSIAGAHAVKPGKLTHGEANLTGIGSYDVNTGQMHSLVWVFDGVYRPPPPYDSPQNYGGVVEWKRERAAK